MAVMRELEYEEVTLNIRIPKYIRREYKEAVSYLGMKRSEDITRHLIHIIGQVNKLKRLEKQGKTREYMDLLLKLIDRKEDEEEEEF